jgi:hypothetical protein
LSENYGTLDSENPESKSSKSRNIDMIMGIPAKRRQTTKERIK